MGSYSTYTKIEKLKEHVLSFITEKKFKVVTKKEIDSQVRINAEGEPGGIGIKSSWEIEPTGNTNSIRMKVEIEKKRQIKLSIKCFIFILILPVGLVIANLFKNQKICEIIISSSMILTVIAGILLISDFSKFLKIVRKFEKEFKEFLDKFAQIKVYSPPDVEIMPLPLAIFFLILLLFLGVFLTRKIPFLLFLILGIYAFASSLIFFSFVGKKDRLLLWKSVLIFNMLRWIGLIFSVILFVFVLYFVNLYMFLGIQSEFTNEDPDTKAFFKLIYSPALVLSSENLIEKRIKEIDKVAEIRYKRLDSEGPKKPIEAFRKTVFLGHAIAIILLPLMSFVYFIILFVGVFKIRDDWKYYLFMGSPTSFKPPSIRFAYKLSSLGFLLNMAFLTVICLPVNFGFAALSIDNLHYIFFEKTIIVKELSILFSLIPTSALLFSRALEFAPLPFLILSKAFLFLISIPFLYFLSRWISIFVRNAIKRFKRFDRGSKDDRKFVERINGILQGLVKSSGTKTPRITISGSRGELVSSRMGLFSKVSIIELDKQFIEKLTDDEVKAVLAHEIGHIKYGLRKLTFLKLLSRLLLFPNFLFTLVLDYRRIEDMADRFAVELIKDKEALKAALMKAYAFQIRKKEHVPDRKRKTSVIKAPNVIKKLKDRFMVLDGFLFGEGLVGYSHPTIMERLIELKKSY